MNWNSNGPKRLSSYRKMIKIVTVPSLDSLGRHCKETGIVITPIAPVTQSTIKVDKSYPVKKT